MPKKSKNRDNTLKSSVEFDKLSPQSRIVRRGRGVESRDHLEANGWRCGTIAKMEDRQKVIRQKGSRGWRMESKVARQRGVRRWSPRSTGKGGVRRWSPRPLGQGDRDKKTGMEALGRVPEEPDGVGMCSPI